MKTLAYLSGFGNHFESEALPGALPRAQNAPQKVPYRLYTEQLSGSAFTKRPRSQNLSSWLYRILPSVCQGPFTPLPQRPASPLAPTPNPLRWGPLPYPKEDADFISGSHHWLSSGLPNSRHGGNVYLYALNKPMENRFFYSADSELLIVLQEGSLLFATEFGPIKADPCEIVVIPRGIKFQVTPLQKHARGYYLENFGAPMALPELGPIGSNGLAATRDFLSPTAHFEEKAGDYQLIAKFMGGLWQAPLQYHPLNVVAWHGNYVPYKYDLRLFNTMNTVSFDHPDPSIFTVLTSQSDTPGVANLDFVIFPPRWMVAEHSFRPPYYHRNVMSEYMGLILGEYDAKTTGFVPGGGSLHNALTGHGPDTDAYNAAVSTALSPTYVKDTMAFMFESSAVWTPTECAVESPIRDKDYAHCWQGLQSHFDPKVQ